MRSASGGEVSVERYGKAPKYADEAKLLDVLRLVAAGYTNGMIGRQLGITENGVKSRMRAMLVWLNAADRAHAVHIGHNRGLLGTDTERAAKAARAEHADGCALLQIPDCDCGATP